MVAYTHPRVPAQPPAHIKLIVHGSLFPAILCDSPAARRKGLAHTPPGSALCCIMIWHHPLSSTTIGALHLSVPYVIAPVLTTRDGAYISRHIVKLSPGRVRKVVLPIDSMFQRRPALIEVPLYLARQFWNNKQLIHWRIPMHDVQILHPKRWKAALPKAKAPHTDEPQ